MKVSVEREKRWSGWGVGKIEGGRVSVFAESESHFSPRQRGRGKVGGVMGRVSVGGDFLIEFFSLIDNFFRDGGGVQFFL
ncbi:hypothetical protein NPIL_430811 [Nephila pilipes]|uniref:Uncharacterized protein n=1 Tax=Nephila pilipes TaxID=299642 RepID=A0A8X6UMW3_NEPPI|nr:hypothetical protein NPIL_430811 [Nephila pilipes]